MNSEIQEAVTVVEELNDVLDNLDTENAQSNFNLRTNGYWTAILFDDIVLWSSEDDSRDYDDDGKQEPLIDCVKNEFVHRITALQGLKSVFKMKASVERLTELMKPFGGNLSTDDYHKYVKNGKDLATVLAALDAANERAERECVWTASDVDDSVEHHRTSCGLLAFMENLPAFCEHCGGKVKESGQ